VAQARRALAIKNLQIPRPALPRFSLGCCLLCFSFKSFKLQQQPPAALLLMLDRCAGNRSDEQRFVLRPKQDVFLLGRQPR